MYDGAIKMYSIVEMTHVYINVDVLWLYVCVLSWALK